MVVEPRMTPVATPAELMVTMVGSLVLQVGVAPAVAVGLLNVNDVPTCTPGYAGLIAPALGVAFTV